MKSLFPIFCVSMPVLIALFLPTIFYGCREEENNRDPILSDPPFIVTMEVQDKGVLDNRALTLVAFATDPDGDTIYYNWEAKLSNDEDVTEKVLKHVIDVTDQRIQFTGITQDTYQIKVTAYDKHGGEDTAECPVSIGPSYLERDKRLAIIEPLSEATVGADIRIKGTYYEIPENKWIALYIHRHGAYSRWVLATDMVVVLMYGLWMADIQIGEKDDSGFMFDVGVKFEDRETISVRGETLVFHDMITVTRK
ncbi:hypothetical protein FJZ33_00370 [Candidatus Poribacteria bacterium]|nr:hypothetical protein [Candidatus Poribacteria bacterium]